MTRWTKRRGGGGWGRVAMLSRFRVRGFECVVLGMSMGHRCGYICVPKSHPWYGRDYNDILSAEVHGGLTFSERRLGSQRSQGWWLGFDTAHAFDWHDPLLMKRLGADARTIEAVRRIHGGEWTRYWNTRDVERELQGLAKQAFAVACELASKKTLTST